MPPNFRRFLPFILIAFFLLIAGQTLFKKHSSGPSAGTRAALTLETINLIGKGEQTYLAANGRFTSHMADLLPLRPHLAGSLAGGVGVQLDVSTDGHRYLAQVASDVLSLIRAYDDAKVTAQSCVILKSGSGVACPASVR